jgi:hypothetical protein
MAGHEKLPVKVIARLRDGKVLRGYVDKLPTEDPAGFLSEASPSLPGEFTLRAAESGENLSIPAASLKALFFVKSFEGRSEYREVKFFDKNPPIKGLWVRVQFYDKESLEGVVQNSIDFLVNPGFFLKPPDPGSNNAIVYVVKSSLADFRVLGVHTDY